MRPHRWQPTRLPGPWDSPGKNTGVGCHFLLQCMKVKSEVVQSFSRVRLFATPWTATHQAPPSMGFSRQECWSGVPSSSPKSLDGSFAIRWLTSILYTSFSLGSTYRSVRKPDIYFQASNGCQCSFPQRLPEFITGVLGKDKNPNWQLLAHLYELEMIYEILHFSLIDHHLLSALNWGTRSLSSYHKKLGHLYLRNYTGQYFM